MSPMPTVVIPARGCSTRVSRKPMMEWKGIPLLRRAIRDCLSQGFTPVVLSEDQGILEYSNRCGAVPQTIPDTIAQLHPLDAVHWYAHLCRTNIIVVQCTTPERFPGIIGQVNYLLQEYNSVATVCQPWSPYLIDTTGTCINRDGDETGRLPESQACEKDKHYCLAGGIYGIQYQDLLEHKTAQFGRFCPVEVLPQHALDIDYTATNYGPKVIVVGNASTLEDQRLGPLIDSHDVVVRVNFFPRTDKKTVGKKTTHWILDCSSHRREFLSTEPGKTLYSDCDHLTEVWFRPSWGEKGPHSDQTGPTDLLPLLDCLCTYRIILENQVRSAVPDTILPDVEHPTTGLVAIRMALHRWRTKIAIAGFGPENSLIPDYSSEEEERVLSTHGYEQERLHINELERLGYLHRY